MKPGTQIAYIPEHADGDITHGDVEFGFVTSERADGAVHFCRYWVRKQPGVLRTRANSEATPTSNLREWRSVLDSEVEWCLRAIQAEEVAAAGQ
jgi:hypothetical protein